RRALEEKESALEAKIGASSKAFAAIAHAATLDEVRSALPDDAALIDYYRYDSYDWKHPAQSFGHAPVTRYMAYVLRRSSGPDLVDLGEAAPIDAIVQTLRAQLSDSHLVDVKPLAHDLATRVLAPALARAGDARQLLVSPDGALNLIPFGALVDDGG